MPLLIFGCQGVLHSSRVVREDGNEEGRLTGRTRFRSGGIGWRTCPIGRLQQRQEHWSILLQNSHWGLMSPRWKAAFPSETEREKRGGEERRTCGGRDGMMEGWRFRKKNHQMECEREKFPCQEDRLGSTEQEDQSKCRSRGQSKREKSSNGGIKQKHEFHSRGLRNIHRIAQGKRDRHKEKEERGMRRELLICCWHKCVFVRLHCRRLSKTERHRMIQGYWIMFAKYSLKGDFKWEEQYSLRLICIKGVVSYFVFLFLTKNIFHL